ncbi:hypothetical protein CTRI78_v003809 [Colletotrichum trifolii]|uniref:Uncharacterized protein n=1 Tax=Colletotrichum trifolii TaxID=5466 RepID=A0A4R8RIY3_COLTR|nr:hypothetical protein CTRI78_v003809 [Colletotrichum trifolii]
MLTQLAVSVLSPGDFDRASLKPSATASERLAFPDATSVSSLPFSTVSFATDLMGYTTTPLLLQTVAAVATSSSAANATATPSGQPVPVPTNVAGGMLPGVALVFSFAVGVAALLI